MSSGFLDINRLRSGSPMMRKTYGNSIIILSVVLWACSIVVGLRYLINYEITPGRASDGQGDWPANRNVQLTAGRINIVMFAHPRCPCTRASLEQLQVLVDRHRDRVSAHILFWKPLAVSPDWEQTDLWRQAMTIPGVHVHTDENGADALRMGALTSGHVIVYQVNGERVFSGGITDARGRFGASRGADAISKLVTDQAIPLTEELPVFGCPLFGSNPACIEGIEPCLK